MSNDRAQYSRLARSEHPEGWRARRVLRLCSEGLVRSLMRIVRLVGDGSRAPAVSRRSMSRVAAHRTAAWVAFRHPAAQGGGREEGTRAVVARSAAARQRAA
jgi:hypothetical protein